MDYSSEEHASGHVQNDVEMFAIDPELLPKDEQPAAVEQDEEMEDLFGNDDDVQVKADGQVTTASSPEPSGAGSDRLPSPERERRKALEYEEDDEPAGVIEEVKEADVQFPNIPVPKSSDGNNWVVRMPNFVKVDARPYHPDTYMGPEHDDEETQQAETLREKSMSIKLKVENTVRWRWVKDTNDVDQKQSNSRIIRWSDGSLSLRLGKELFDITQAIDTSGTVPRQSYGPSSHPQSQASAESGSAVKSQGLTYLVAQHKHAQVLQSESVITGYMTLRPMGMQSETHRMLVRAVGQKHNKVARLKMAPDPTVDPEKEVKELEKADAKKSKRRNHGYGAAADEMEEGLGGRSNEGGSRKKKRSYSRRKSGHDVWSDDDDDEGQEFAASDEEEEDGGMGSGAGSPRKTRRTKEGDDEKKGGYQEDDFVVADVSSDEEGGSRKKRRGKNSDEDTEEDALDKLEAKIENEQKKWRERAGGKATKDDDDSEDEDGKEAGDEGAMEVESEEDEDDEVKVRKAGAAGPKKRRAIDFDDEEDE